MGALDVYLNVAGGLRVSEPAADLAVAAALLSSLFDAALPPETVLFGEVSLTGAIRPVTQMETRLKEAAKLGFSHAIGPSGMTARSAGQTLRQVDLLKDLVSLLRSNASGHAEGEG
jgi:DNA repair protein RadA/Sms